MKLNYAKCDPTKNSSVCIRVCCVANFTCQDDEIITKIKELKETKNLSSFQILKEYPKCELQSELVWPEEMYSLENVINDCCLLHVT